jgi:hypothetical protein
MRTNDYLRDFARVTVPTRTSTLSHNSVQISCSSNDEIPESKKSGSSAHF